MSAGAHAAPAGRLVHAVLCAALAAAACHRAADAPGDASQVRQIDVSVPQTLVVGALAHASAVMLDAAGDTITDRAPAWSSLTPAVISVDAAGNITGLQAGSATVRATSGVASGQAQVQVKNPTAGSITFSRDTATLTIPGGSTQLIATVRDAGGVLIQSPSITWQSSAPLVATVNSSGLVTGIAAGAAAITATIDGQVATANIGVTVLLSQNSPLIVSIDPTPLRPGGTFTVVGNNFAPTPAGNIVVVDGVAATVNAATVNALSITLPATFACNPAHDVFIQVTANGVIGGGASTLQIANPRTLAVGQSAVITDPTQVRCNELDLTGGRYAVSVYNAYRSTVTAAATGAVAVTVRGAVPLASPPSAALRVPSTAREQWNANTLRMGSQSFDAAEQLRRQREADRVHATILGLSARFAATHATVQRRQSVTQSGLRLPASGVRPNLVPGVSAQVAVVGNITTVKIPNLDAANFCMTSTSIGMRTVYTGAHSIVLEDTTTVFAGAPTLAGQMDDYLTRLGQEFDNVMYPIVLANFGNPLVLDSQLSGLGKVVMAFSPRVNGTAEGSILGFVVSCDLFPVATAPSSNVGEYFYAAVPTSTALGYFDPNTRDSWMRLMRPTLIHELKHITAFALRQSLRLAPEELAWEEGMARSAEELYARTFYGTQPKQDAGYAATVGCDVQYATGAPPCAGRPLMMLRHFDALYSAFGEPETETVLGRTSPADFTFYGTAWSMERWANDIFAASEPQFFSQWTLSGATGVANLEARTGQPWEQSLGEWSLAMYTDDIPGFTPANPHLKFMSWNLRDIWAGMCADMGPCVNPANPVELYPSASPFNPRFEAFGNFVVTVNSIVGGGFTIFDISGSQTAKQLIEVKSPNGTDPPATVRIAIVRIQ